MRTYSAGLAGRLDVAFTSVAQLGAVVAEQGQHADRFQPIVHNMRGWLLGTAGQWSAAAEAGEEALALAAEIGFGEPGAHAVLDLAENRLRAGDHAGAADRLGQAAAIAADDRVSMAWHQRQRLAWLRGRLALATGDRATAATEAAWLTSDAVDRGTRRYELLPGCCPSWPKASSSPTLWSRCWMNSNGLPHPRRGGSLLDSLSPEEWTVGGRMPNGGWVPSCGQLGRFPSSTATPWVVSSGPNWKTVCAVLAEGPRPRRAADLDDEETTFASPLSSTGSRNAFAREP